jgi:hypothetical protein
VSQEFVRTNPNHIGYVQYLQMFNDHVVDETFTEEKRDNIKSDHGKEVNKLPRHVTYEPFRSNCCLYQDVPQRVLQSGQHRARSQSLASGDNGVGQEEKKQEPALRGKVASDTCS